MSSSTTLWATASKEWVIQPKPKPGRKPKKDSTPSTNIKDNEEVDVKGRRVQNRAAQRAFRERKQSQLAELQARILSYEQGEIERNVALQNIAKRLKEENERLWLENKVLREKVSKLEEDQPQKTCDNDRKRLRDNSPTSLTAQESSAKKRSRTTTPPQPDISTSASASYHSSPSPMVSTPDSGGNSESQFPDLSYTLPTDTNHNSLNDILGFSSHVKGVNDESVQSFAPFECGFCSENIPCVCREFALDQTANGAILASFKSENYTDTPLVIEDEGSVSHAETSRESPRTSILENLPAYQPPVPLRRRPGNSPIKPIFPVFSSRSVDSQNRAGPICSGDPSNCAACNDDVFGKAFCSAIEETVTAHDACENCPARQLNGPGVVVNLAKIPRLAVSGCCGNPLACGNQKSVSSEPDYIPTNDAWRRIKAHPNVEFADLSLLAEVVASRSKCTGPRIVLSPPPDYLSNGCLTQRRLNSVVSDQAILLTDPHAQYRDKDKSFSLDTTSPRHLVPQEILLECGRRRLREVHPEAVRDALRLLDAKFT